MKVEIGESLGYSYLRHVKLCWLVQANWKASEHWHKRLTDDELEQEFGSMRAKLESHDSAFKGSLKETKTCSQFLKQAEIDVVGVRLDGSVYAVEVAFHEGGLINSRRRRQERAEEDVADDADSTGLPPGGRRAPHLFCFAKGRPQDQEEPGERL
jgi:hypothetical protein